MRGLAAITLPVRGLRCTAPEQAGEVDTSEIRAAS